MFKKRQPSQLGIDIGSSSIKLCEISFYKQQFTIENYSIQPLAENVVVDKIIKQPALITQAIEAALGDFTSKATTAIIAVPDTHVITKTISIDASCPAEEMAALISIQAAKYIPYPLSEINFDFTILGVTPQQPHLLDVLVVATRTNTMDARVAVVAQAGLTVTAVDIESHAMVRASRLLNLLDTALTTAIIDMGARYTKLTVVRHNALIFNYEEPFGSQQLIDALRLHYPNVTHATLVNDITQEALMAFLQMALVQLKRALQFFSLSTYACAIEALLLIGGVTQLTGLATFVQQELRITVLPNVLLPPKMLLANKLTLAEFTHAIPSLMMSCGLALHTHHWEDYL